MRWRILLCLVLLRPTLATAAEPSDADDDTDRRAIARETLAAKLIEAAKLGDEIARLRQEAGEPSRNCRLRVRVFEVSLTKIQHMGQPHLTQFEGNAAEVDRQLDRLTNENLVRMLHDEIFVVADGSRARLLEGIELPNSAPHGKTDGKQTDVEGTEVLVSPRWQVDGRLRVELVCRQARPVFDAGKMSHFDVHDSATTAEMAPDDVVAIQGIKDRRVESVRTSVLGTSIGRTTHTFNYIQTFVVVTRESELTDGVTGGESLSSTPTRHRVATGASRTVRR